MASASASKSSRSSGRRSATAARWRATVASSPRAIGPVSARCGAERGPVGDARPHERDERLAVEARGLREALGEALERDEEVRGDRGGGVVGGAVGVGDLRPAACRASCASACGGGERARRRAGDRRGRAGERRARRAVTVISGCSENASCGAERGERRGGRACGRRGGPARAGSAAAAASIWPSGTHSSTACGVGGRRLAAAQRALDVDCGGAQRAGQRRAHAAGADDREAIEGACLGRQRKLGLRGHRVGPVLQEVPVAVLMCERLAPPRLKGS